MASKKKPDHELRVIDRPDFETGECALRLVDLFSGCGGLTLGIAQAANDLSIAVDVVLAVDNVQDALDIYQKNFPKSTTLMASIEELLDGAVGQPITVRERAFSKRVGRVDALVGGPPCQGHSDLNNHTRRKDPRNGLYFRMVRAAEVFEPTLLLIENVPAVRHASNNVVNKSVRHLRKNGYDVSDGVVLLSNLGVPQTRRRHVLLATKIDGVSSEEVLTEVLETERNANTVRWAIGDLAKKSSNTVMDAHPKASDKNYARMKKMIRYGWYDLPNKDRPLCHQNEQHSYRSMYGRLEWTKPAQTITSGFTSIGQGRYMHPDQPRALTMHEAARLQGFPDYFDFSSATNRSSLATMIGNAVPPALAFTIFQKLIPHLELEHES